MFKVGDIILGKKNNDYTITCTGSVCRVTGIDDGDEYNMPGWIEVEVLRTPYENKIHKEEEFVGQKYDVEEKYFEPYTGDNDASLALLNTREDWL